MKRLTVLVMMVAMSTLGAYAQSMEEVVAQIQEEGMERSQVMQTMHVLTDVYGPRLTGSPSLARAGEWVLEQTTEWGLENAHKDDWDWGRPGWENERVSAHIISPVKDQLTVEVLAWTPSTNGTVISSVAHIVPPSGPTQEELDAYFADIREQIAGRIVLVGETRAAPLRLDPRPLRRDDDQVRETYRPNNTNTPNFGRRGGGNRAEGVLNGREVDAQLNAFFVEQGVAVRVNPSTMEDGLIRAFSNRTYEAHESVPALVMRNEDYGRITRLVNSDYPVELEFTVVNRFYPEGRTEYNYIAEIPGTEFPDEVVMLGGHLDSWHAATGATDNAAGSAAMMEAVRILTTLGVKPRRTIRLALWTGEEQGLLGSQAYVAEHFGTFEDQKPAYSKFGGYFNIDSGTGRLRGASVFGPQEAAFILDGFLEPFEEMGVAGARPGFSRSLGGSDHTAFNAAGLPGISMGQDPIKYFSHTWHTNVDNYERILEDDLKQAAIVVAAAVYGLAMQDSVLPRFSDEDMPAARGRR